MTRLCQESIRFSCCLYVLPWHWSDWVRTRFRDGRQPKNFLALSFWVLVTTAQSGPSYLHSAVQNAMKDKAMRSNLVPVCRKDAKHWSSTRFVKLNCSFCIHFNMTCICGWKGGWKSNRSRDDGVDAVTLHEIIWKSEFSGREKNDHNALWAFSDM